MIATISEVEILWKAGKFDIKKWGPSRLKNSEFNINNKKLGHDKNEEKHQLLTPEQYDGREPHYCHCWTRQVTDHGSASHVPTTSSPLLKWCEIMLQLYCPLLCLHHYAPPRCTSRSHSEYVIHHSGSQKPHHYFLWSIQLFLWLWPLPPATRTWSR